MTPPHPSSALPPQALHEAVPKGISGRASYFHVCLAFHSLPQVIATFFNRLPFGPPHGFTHASACPWQDHIGFGSAPRDWTPCSGSLSLRLRHFNALASPRNATRRFILQKTRRKHLVPTTSCRYTVSGSISLPSPGFFSPFPHGTPALSVAALYLALDRGRPRFRQGFTCPALLRYRIMESLLLRVRGCHPLRPRCPAGSAASAFLNSTGHPHAALQPRTNPVWAPPRSLAATCGISIDLFSRVT